MPSLITDLILIINSIHRMYLFVLIGIPISERQFRGTTSIKVLDDEEQEGMKVACLVSVLEDQSM